MNETARQISELINATSPSGANTTHALAELGNGNMQNGLKRIVTYFAKNSASNLKLGRIQGAAGGALGVAAIAGIVAHLVQKHKKNQLDKEGQEILKTLERSSTQEIVSSEGLSTKSEVVTSSET